jgi:hypothetical protein
MARAYDLADGRRGDLNKLDAETATSSIGSELSPDEYRQS